MNNGTIIYIYHNAPSVRMEYVAGFLSESLRMNFEFTGNAAQRNPMILYGNAPGLNGFSIPDSGLLTESVVRNFVPEIELNGNIQVFPVRGEYDLSFDIFSAIFYFISRYEEYLPFKADPFGRFELDQSFLYKNNIHRIPVVDHWLMALTNQLELRFPELKFPQKKFCFISTFDIDSPWAFKNRKPIRNLAGLLKNLAQGKPGDFIQRLRVILNQQDDPFDTYSFISETETLHRFCSHFFFLMADRGTIDPNHSLHSQAYSDLVRRISSDHITGIHPSFHSNADPETLSEEISTYRSITGKAPENSRQHYLILRFPETYRKLSKHEITNDYSMGYASGIGFRAGTTLPFRFYDLTAEQQTRLTVHPFSVMDVTLRQYMKLDPEAATKTISELINNIRSVNGVFISLWHNESLSDTGIWKGWRKVFIEMVGEASPPEGRD